MINTVYVHKFDEPIKYKDFKGNDAFKESELRCIDERVERVWYYGGMSMSEGDKKAYAYVSFLFKNGVKHEKQLTTDRWEEEASKFLNSIDEKQ